MFSKTQAVTLICLFALIVCVVTSRLLRDTGVVYRKVADQRQGIDVVGYTKTNNVLATKAHTENKNIPVSKADKPVDGIGKASASGGRIPVEGIRTSADLRKVVSAKGLSWDTVMPVMDRKMGLRKGMIPPEDDWRVNLLNGTSIVPKEGIDESLRGKTEEGKDDQYCILQFRKQITLKQLDDVLSCGVTLYDCIGDNGYIVKVHHTSVSMLDSVEMIHSLIPYKADYKFAPDLYRDKEELCAIVAFDEISGDEKKQLEGLGVRVLDICKDAKMATARIDFYNIQKVANECKWVKGFFKLAETGSETLFTSQVSVNFEPNDSRQLVCAYETPYQGEGVTIGLRDKGRFENPCLQGVFVQDSSVAESEDSIQDVCHATEVSGVIAGRTKSISGPWGISQVSGVAPRAMLLFRDFNDGNETSVESHFKNSLELFESKGVKISNHSWGFPPCYRYRDSLGSEYADEYCDEKDMLLIFAAGNDGLKESDYEIPVPGLSKNVLTVGGIEYVSGDAYEEKAGLVLHRTSRIGKRNTKSSTGPIFGDKRLKPEIVAPGGDIIGYYGVATCYGLGQNVSTPNYPWETDSTFARVSGTSFAAPHVTGVAAKILEWSPNISSEMMKALLINTTIPLKDNSDDALAGYATTEVGYGMVNGYSVTHNYAGESSRLLFQTGTLAEGATATYDINVPVGTKELRVTMAYNDRPGQYADDKAIKDDLDLFLDAPNGVCYTAFEHKAEGVSGESPLEKTVILNPQAGNWKVRVFYSYSPSWLVDQKYAVVAHAIMKTPALTVSMNNTSTSVNPGQKFILNPMIRNTGGYIAAGVTATVRANAADGFGGQVNQSRYLRNLMYQNDGEAPFFEITAPSVPGTYSLVIEGDGINREFKSGYPKQLTFTVTVNPVGTADFDFTVDGGWATITKYKGVGSVVNVPASIGGNPVIAIGDVAFENCSHVTSINLPASIWRIGLIPFSGCLGLLEINVDSENQNYESANGVLFNKDKTEILAFPGGRSGAYAIPSGVTSIGWGAFTGCKKLTGITIPSSVTYIGDWAFSSCSGLTGVTIPSGVTELRLGTFAECSGLASVTLSEGLRSIGEYAFSDCSNVTSISIPSSVTSLGSRAFRGCDRLVAVTFSGNAPSLGLDVFQYTSAIIYFRGGTSGWSDPWGGRPTVRSVTVSFNPNGGVSPVPSSKTVTAGQAYGALPTSSKTGFVFGGWWTGSGGTGKQVSADTTVEATANHELYAKWLSFQSDAYIVIDIEGGANAQCYPVYYYSSSEEVPGGVTYPLYQMTKILLRRVPAGTYTVGSPDGELGKTQYESRRTVQLTQDYFIGVYEITQAQWFFLMNTEPSYFYGGDTSFLRPVENVSYDDIRGASLGRQWPTSSEVDASSFIGKLRQKTGMSGLDLPTEAQWEVACRALTVTALNNGKNLTSTTFCSDLAEVGRHFAGMAYPWDDETVGTAVVGSLQPNIWGLYDMHGNVAEWCLDFWGEEADGQVNPKGPMTGTSRVIRGGSWRYDATYCRSAFRWPIYSAALGMTDSSKKLALVGFRVGHNYSKQYCQITYKNGVPSSSSSPTVYVMFGMPYGDLWTPPSQNGCYFGGWWTGVDGTGVPITRNTMVTASTNHNIYAWWKFPLAEVLNPSLSWTTSTNGWFGQSAVSYNAWDGRAAQSGRLSLFADSWIATTVVGPGEMNFNWKVSAIQDYDFLRVYVDGVDQGEAISGETDWQMRTLVLTNGQHTIRWVYSKGWIGTSRSDCGWLDDVQWNPFYRVICDPQGGDVNPKEILLGTGGMYNPDYWLPTPTRTGFTFDGWWSGQNGIGTRFDDSNWVIVDGADQRIYANWLANTYELSFDATGGTPTPYPKQVMYDQPYGFLNIPPRPYHVFDGWWTSPHGEGLLIDDTSIVNIEGDHILYANWKVLLEHALESPEFQWETEGSVPWFGQTKFSCDRQNAVQSGKISDGQSSVLKTTIVVAEPSIISFWWKVSSEAGGDVLSFYINGVNQTPCLSGEVDWAQQVFDIGAGTHVLEWVYAKNAAVSAGCDCGWVDQFSVTETGMPLTITFEPDGGFVDIATKEVLSGSFFGALPIATHTNAEYLFSGWYTGKGGNGICVSSNMVVSLRDDHKLYAKWKLPLEVWTLQHLQKVGSGIDGWTLKERYKVMNDIDASATADWNDAGTDDSVKEGFMPIGDLANGFSGVFDGNNHTIFGLTINRPKEDWIGLTRQITVDGIIFNLKLINGSVMGKGQNDIGDNCYGIGSLSAWNDGCISNCSVNLTVSGSLRYVGGLAGVNNGTIVFCCASGTVVGNRSVGGLVGSGGGKVLASCASGNVTGNSYVGGFIGFKSGYVENCSSTGSVTGVNSVGGFAGYSQGPISHCYSAGQVIGSGEAIGGFIGDNGGTAVESSYWDTQASGISWSAGGEGRTTEQMKQQATFAGWNFIDVWGILEGTGSPYLFAFSTYTITFDPQAGSVGLFSKRVKLGRSYDDLPRPERDGFTFRGWWTVSGGVEIRITDSSIVTISSNHTLYAKWDVPFEVKTLQDLQKVGSGVNGWTLDASYKLMNNIDASQTASWNSGAGFMPIGTWKSPFTGVFDGNKYVIRNLQIYRPKSESVGLFGRVGNGGEVMNLGVIGGKVTGYPGVGGIIGVLQEAGIINNCFSAIQVIGVNQVGGLVGVNDGHIINCYSTGSVIYSHANSNYSGGGLVGQGWGTVVDSFWDVETSGQLVSHGGDGKTTAEMKKRLTFQSWNFTQTWGIVEGTTYPYFARYNLPVISKRSPVTDSLTTSEGLSTIFSVTVNDNGDPLAPMMGMVSVTWFVDGLRVLETKTGAPNAIISSFNYKPDFSYAQGVSFKDIQVKVVGLDRQDETVETNWTMRVYNVSVAQTITFPLLPVKALGAPDFVPGARASSGLSVVYSNSNPAVAQVVGGMIHIVGTGTAVITASQPGNFDYKAALPVKQTLTVKARLTPEFVGNGTVTASPSSAWLYAPGTKVTLTAKPATGNTFLRWDDGSQTAVRSLVMPNANMTVSAWFNITTNVPKPVITNPGAQSVMVGVPFQLALQVASECLPTVTMTGLPAGLTFDVGTWTISGVPTAVPAGGKTTVNVSASNPSGKAADAKFTITVAPLAAKAQGTFTGIAIEPGVDADTVKGLFTMTITPVGAISAKVTGQASAISFTGKSWDTLSNGVFQALLRTVKGEALAIALDTGVAWNAAGLQGTLTGGVFGASALAVRGQRNAFLVKTAPDYVAATNVLASYKGYYTVALPAGTLSDAGAAVNAPQGSGYLALTVKDGGAVTLAGKLADGTALSGSATLFVQDAGVAGISPYVPLFFPLYSARGVFSGLMELGSLTWTAPSNNFAAAVEKVVQAWRYPGRMPTAIPPQTEDRFELTLGMSGGYYNSLQDLRAHYSNRWFSAQMPGVTNTYFSGIYTTKVGVVQGTLPDVQLAFNPATGAISLPLGKAPVYTAGAYVYAPTNPAAATLAVTKATGLFTGKFNLYYEYLDQVRAFKLKTVSITHEGVLTPMRLDDAMPSGQGFYLVPDTWKSTGVPSSSYPLNRSYEVEVRFEER